MPLLYKEIINNNSELGVWHITEASSFFSDALILYKEEEDELLTLSDKKKAEWYASRYLLHILSGRSKRAKCIKDEFGKPHLPDSAHEVSLSHSHNLTAVIASKGMTGIDIQVIVPKIERLAHKYMSKDELSSIEGKEGRLTYLHIYWGAKEALYKAYGRRGVDFIKELVIDPFEIVEEEARFTGYVLKDNFLKEFRLISKRIHDAILVYAIEA